MNALRSVPSGKSSHGTALFMVIVFNINTHTHTVVIRFNISPGVFGVSASLFFRRFFFCFYIVYRLLMRSFLFVGWWMGGWGGGEEWGGCDGEHTRSWVAELL